MPISLGCMFASKYITTYTAWMVVTLYTAPRMCVSKIRNINSPVAKVCWKIPGFIDYSTSNLLYPMLQKSQYICLEMSLITRLIFLDLKHFHHLSSATKTPVVHCIGSCYPRLIGYFHSQWTGNPVLNQPVQCSLVWNGFQQVTHRDWWDLWKSLFLVQVCETLCHKHDKHL